MRQSRSLNVAFQQLRSRERPPIVDSPDTWPKHFDRSYGYAIQSLCLFVVTKSETRDVARAKPERRVGQVRKRDSVEAYLQMRISTAIASDEGDLWMRRSAKSVS